MGRLIGGSWSVGEVGIYNVDDTESPNRGRQNVVHRLGWYTTPVSGVLDLGDRTKNAGDYGHGITSALCGKAFAY